MIHRLVKTLSWLLLAIGILSEARINSLVPPSVKLSSLVETLFHLQNHLLIEFTTPQVESRCDSPANEGWQNVRQNHQRHNPWNVPRQRRERRTSCDTRIQ